MATETDICNMALGRIGAKQLTALDTDTSVQATQCNLHLDQTRDALLRAHWWKFAMTRLELADAWATATVYTTDQYVSYSSTWYKCAVAHTSDSSGGDGTGGYPNINTTDWTAQSTATMTPQFEWDLQFSVPSALLRLHSIYEGDHLLIPYESYALEGSKILTNETTMQIRYIQQVTTTTSFDNLFIEVLVLQLAIKLSYPLIGTGRAGIEVRRGIQEELYRKGGLMARVLMVSKEEQNKFGRYDYGTWNDARTAGTGNPLKRYS